MALRESLGPAAAARQLEMWVKTLANCATAASIHETTGHPAAVAFGARNLESVAFVLRAKFPSAMIVVCADDDAATTVRLGQLSSLSGRLLQLQRLMAQYVLSWNVVRRFLSRAELPPGTCLHRRLGASIAKLIRAGSFVTDARSSASSRQGTQ